MNGSVSTLRALRLGAALLTVAAAAALWSSPVTAAPSAGAAAKADPDRVLIRDASAPRSHRFAVPVPAGGRLRAADPAKSTGDILVLDAAGTVVGAYDGAWAQDAAGRPVPTGYRIEGATIVQTVETGAGTAFPVVIDPIYSPVTAAGGASAKEPQSRLEAGPDGGMVLLAYVGVPSNYVYNPALGSLHDYCTASPDEFPNPVGPNANFRGPCARHDLCYGGGTISKFTCDNRLYSDMVSNCDYYYPWYNPARAACRTTAEIYWIAVVAAN